MEVTVDPNTLFANVDGIKKALGEAEAEARKPQGAAKIIRGGGIKKGL
jgi:hypothetical protein